MEKKKDKLKKVVKKKNLPTIKKNTKLVIKEGAQISKNLNVKWTKFKKSDKLLDKINYLFSEFNKNDLFHEISKVNKIKLGRFKTIIETIQKRKNWLNKNENFKKLEDAILKVNFIKKFNEKNNWIPVTPDYTEGKKNRYNGRKLSVQEFNEILNPDGP
jgi:tyrosine-protein phosphatase YwqE